MLNHYETVFILTPVLSEPQMKETAARFKGFLENGGAKIVNEESWGLKKLAYPIENKTTGFYSLIEFDAEPNLIESLTTQFRRDEKVIRFMITKLDKNAAEYAVKRRSKSKSNEAKED